MTTSAFAISSHNSSASAPRQHATKLAHTLGFNETRAGQAALVASELATNIAKHAHDGQILIQDITAGERRGVEVLALDRGPGIPPHALRDGYSTAGSLGAGLGAVQRQADQFEIFSQSGSGTIAVARLWASFDVAPPSVSGVSVAKRGEGVCGDAWGCHLHPADGRLVCIVVDGLGHGPLAAAAAAAAMRVFGDRALLAPPDLLVEIHQALRTTRGAAVAIAVVDRERQVLRFAGLGNIAASIIAADRSRQSLASHNGTAGVSMRRIQEFAYPLPPHGVLVMHSDGLATHWAPESYVGVWNRDPALAAGALFRDHTRGRDDCTVVVARLDP
jgi:anti-sigma regulatory factor (Ser/Thr protein kinase)